MGGIRGGIDGHDHLKAGVIGHRLQAPQRQAVIKEPNGTLRVVSQAALHIAPARSARQQGRHVQIGEGLSRGSGSSGAAATARPAGRGALAQGAGQWKSAGLGQRA